MDFKLIESSKRIINGKTVKVQFFQITEDSKSPQFIAKANYKSTICYGDTLEEVKRKFEAEIEIKRAVASGELKLINHKKAFKIARIAFKEFLKKYSLPEGFKRRLGISMWTEGKYWIGDVLLYPTYPENTDLDGKTVNDQPDVLAVIRINGETEETSISEKKAVLEKVMSSSV